MVTDLVNEFFQTGTIGTNNLGLYFSDVILDIGFSMLYLDKVGGIARRCIGAFVGGTIDAIVDITETALYFTPDAQRLIREGSSAKMKNPRYFNKMSFVY